VFDRWQSPLLSLPVDLLHQALHSAGPVRREDPDFNVLLVEPTEKNLCSWRNNYFKKPEVERALGMTGTREG